MKIQYKIERNGLDRYRVCSRIRQWFFWDEWTVLAYTDSIEYAHHIVKASMSNRSKQEASQNWEEVWRHP